MQGLAPHRVIYGGSASKTLAPGIRLGWLIAPPRLAKALGDAKIAADRGSPALEQLALADLIRRGELDRHLRRLRPVYRRRRDVLLASLRTHLPALRPTGISAGMHLLTWLPDELNEETVIARAAAAGIRLDGLRPYRLTNGGPGGLIFGYAAITESAIPGAVRALAEAIR